jgi:hypothetical protein
MPGNYGSKMGGSTKSTARSAPMENKTGNYGKAIGDTGARSKKGNRRTRQAADRYK